MAFAKMSHTLTNGVWVNEKSKHIDSSSGSVAGEALLLRGGVKGSAQVVVSYFN